MSCIYKEKKLSRNAGPTFGYRIIFAFHIQILYSEESREGICDFWQKMRIRSRPKIEKNIKIQITINFTHIKKSFRS